MLNALRAEILKWRHNRFPLVVAAAAFAGPLLVGLMGTLHGDNPPAEQVMRSLLMFHLLLIGPLLVTLVGAQLMAAEYQWDSWKLLLVAPVPRWSIYMAKWLLGIIWILLLSLLVPLFGFLISHLVHATGSLEYWLWMKVFVAGGIGLCALLSGFQFITLVTRNFFVASGVGIVATFTGLLVAQSRYTGVYPISGNLLMAQMMEGRAPDPTLAIIGTSTIWTAILVALAIVGLVASLVYVQKADYR